MASYHKPVKTRRASERDGILFWILPPLLLGAVFAFCSMANSNEEGVDDKKPVAGQKEEQ